LPLDIGPSGRTQGTDLENSEFVRRHFTIIGLSTIGGIEQLFRGIQMFPNSLFRIGNRQPGNESIFLIRNEFHLTQIYAFTSSISRNALPSKLNASTSNIIANPGASASMGLCVIMKL